MPNNRQRNANIVAMRDQGYTFDHIANIVGLAHAGSTRRAWMAGLREAGREVPTTSLRVHTGRTTQTIIAETQMGFAPSNAMTFGIEIECIGLSCTQAQVALSNAGISVVNNGYTHAVIREWKVVPDGSLHARNGSCEVVSPILRGQDGMNQVRTVMMILRTAGATVNPSCGMHIHLGVEHYTPQILANIVMGHQQWQIAFDAFTTPKRQVFTTTYLGKRTMASAHDLARMIAGCVDNREVKNIVERGSRYKNLNVVSFKKYGTYEIRNHQGSLNGMNATAWIAFNQAFIEAVADDALYPCTSLDGFDDYSLGTEMNGENAMGSHRSPKLMQVTMAKVLINQLRNADYITAELAEYLTNRAGNLRYTI